MQTIPPALAQVMKGKRVLEGKPADRVDFSTGVEEAGSHERTEISTPPPIDGDVFGSRNVEVFPRIFPPLFPNKKTGRKLMASDLHLFWWRGRESNP